MSPYDVDICGLIPPTGCQEGCHPKMQISVALFHLQDVKKDITSKCRYLWPDSTYRMSRRASH
jgi:hypothetical protein